MRREILRPASRVADQNVQRFLGLRGWAALVHLAAYDAVDIFRNCLGIGQRQREGRHRWSALGGRPTLLHDGNDGLAGLIAKYERGAQQIRAAEIAAAQIRAVAGLAVDAKQGLAARDDGGVARWPLLTRKGCLPKNARRTGRGRSG